MRKNRSLLIIVGIVILVILAGVLYWSKNQRVDPLINPANFVSGIDNKYFTLVPGKRFTYESKTDEGTERVEVEVTRETKKIMGVVATVVRDRVWLNDKLIEDTKDWYAQDKEGNVWYFGEDTVELIDGQVVNRAGSWEAGVDGAKAGIIMKAKPKVGETYRQEYYKGKAEDMAQVLALNASITVPFGTFNNCLQTLDYTPLEPSVKEHKYYCPSVGQVALVVDQDGNTREELIAVDTVESALQPSTYDYEKQEELKTEITQEQAKEIALRKVSGTVTDVAVEEKFGKLTFVIEIAAESGVETDVVVDVNTGEVLAVEK